MVTPCPYEGGMDNTAPRAVFCGDYAEASFFDGFHYQHIAAWLDVRRQRERRRVAAAAFERRRHLRA